MRSYEVFRLLEEKVKAMVQVLPLVQDLHHPAMRDRHWLALQKVRVRLLTHARLCCWKGSWAQEEGAATAAGLLYRAAAVALGCSHRLRLLLFLPAPARCRPPASASSWTAPSRWAACHSSRRAR